MRHGRADGLKINILNVLNIYCLCNLHQAPRRSIYFDEIDKLSKMYLDIEWVCDNQKSHKEYLLGHQ